jgi:hypothetical protein
MMSMSHSEAAVRIATEKRVHEDVCDESFSPSVKLRAYVNYYSCQQSGVRSSVLLSCGHTGRVGIEDRKGQVRGGELGLEGRLGFEYLVGTWSTETALAQPLQEAVRIRREDTCQAHLSGRLR